MNTTELIESGIIELYVLGIAADEERALVEQFASDVTVKKEIAAVRHSLTSYARATGSVMPPAELKKRILSFIETSVNNLPPAITESSTPSEWISYLDQQKISVPSDFKGIYFLELPGNEDYYTYAVWGNEGGSVEEELHNDHREYLFVCEGECELSIDGKATSYKKGDYIQIEPGVRHSAKVTGKELLLVIGQRRVA